MKITGSGNEPAENDAQPITALGHWVHVYVDRVTRKSVPIPDAVRALLATAAVDQ